MAAIIEALHQDHANLTKLLQLLEQEIDKFKQDNDPDYTLMSEILDYIISYPNEFHHPKEDAIYETFIRKHPESQSTLLDLQEDHKKLGALTEEFNDSLKMISAGQTVRRSKFEEIARDYIDATRQHIHTEENEVFPLIEKHLEANDWASIENALAAHDHDPLFGNGHRTAYENLYAHVTRWR